MTKSEQAASEYQECERKKGAASRRGPQRLSFYHADHDFLAGAAWMREEAAKVRTPIPRTIYVQAFATEELWRISQDTNEHAIRRIGVETEGDE